MTLDLTQFHEIFFEESFEALDSMEAALLKLSVKRAVTLPVRTAMAAFRPIQTKGRALSEAIVEDREDRF